MSTADINQDFVTYERLFRATQEITREEFVSLVTDFFGGKDRDYAENCWPQFCQSPLGYIFSRSPLEQGERLFELIQQKAMTEDIHNRCFSTEERRYSRYREAE